MAQLRTLAVPIGVLAAVLLFLLVNPWIVLDGAISQIVTVGFWVSFIVLLISPVQPARRPGRREHRGRRPDLHAVPVQQPARRAVLAPDPPLRRVRLARGRAGTSSTSPAWMGDQAGTAILGYWQNAVAIPEEGHAAITYDWYRTFLQFLIDNGAEKWFSYADRVRRDRRRPRLDRRRVDRLRGVLRRVDEHVVPACRDPHRRTRSCSRSPSG